MNGYFSYVSAAIHWNIPCLDVVIGREITECDVEEITVPDHSARFRRKGVKVHGCQLPLPANAVVSRNSIKVSSPELLFLEFARRLDMHRLILLGLQLCSYKPGQPSQALTTKQNPKAFLEKTSGHRGHGKALRAVKYIENGSASIMESLAFMILTLPYALGGYGLSGAVFNHGIKLQGKARARLEQDRCYIDLYYRHKKVGVEYESFAHHSTPSEIGKGAIRSAVLRRRGITMLHLNTIQLYDRDACRDFAYTLAARLGKRIHIRTAKFEEMHERLRQLLPQKQSDSANPLSLNTWF